MQKRKSLIYPLLALGLVMLACASSTPTTPSPTITALPTFWLTSPPTATQTLPPETTLEPSPTPVTTVRLAVIGDYGLAGKPLQQVADLVNSWNVDFIATVGDNNYPDGEEKTMDRNVGQYFHQYIHPYVGEYGEGGVINRFFPALGNHDWNTRDLQPHYDYFELPGNERYYDVLWEFVHIFIVDSDSREPDGIGRSSVQAAWLQESLAASTAPWKLVFMHHAPYSSAKHGPYEPVQWPYQEWGATAVIAGHDHVYERILINGFPYFTNGLGGSPDRYFFTQNTIEGSQKRYRKNHGAMLIDATPQSMTFQFITVDGDLIDSYTIELP
ncbi:MAG: alkaline phosphatase [Chloroflexi bacterium]|nr:alkaline phosphatase [Chloroflexota bacterium]